tara:strand:- start:1127 stop:4225 length:3099 start_codon:yes stop_codon:yes gene_type:complete
MKEKRGLIGYMIDHPLAANLIMVTVLLAGFLTYGMMNVQFLPQFDIKLIRIQAIWPGAKPEDVETNLLKPVENQIKGLNGVDFFESTAAYNMGMVMVELKNDADTNQVYDEIGNRIDNLTNLPQDAERIRVSRIINYEPVARLVVSAEDPDALKYYVDRIRDELYVSGIDQIYLAGNTARKINIEIPLKHLYQASYGLPMLANLIESAMKSRPLGDIGSGVDATLLTVGQKRVSPDQIRQVALKLPQFKKPVTVEDIATVRYVTDSQQPFVLSNNQRSIEMNLKRSQNTNTLDAANSLYKWLETAKHNLPKTLNFSVVEERWKLIRDRIMLLVENGATGLLLIFGLLVLFFNLRIAFWIALGIPISFATAIMILYAQGGTINMISLFALIMTLGIIVDDTIVVGEQAVTEFENGKDPKIAAYLGATKMLSPIAAASLTTIAAFFPLLVLTSLMGDILRDIPLVAITVITASLIECFIILPNHMVGAFNALKKHEVPKWRERISEGIRVFQFSTFKQIVSQSVSHPIMIFSITALLFAGAYSLIKYQIVGFDFFPQPPSPNLYLDVKFTPGSTQEQRLQYLSDSDTSLRSAAKALGDESIIKSSIVYANRATPFKAGGLVSADSGSKFGSMIIELKAPDQRSINNEELKAKWYDLLPVADFVESTVVQEPKGGPPGQDISIMLINQSPKILKQASNELISSLKNLDYVSNIVDNLPYGKKIINLSVNAKGKQMGFDTQSISSQLRTAINGIEIDNYYESGVEHPIEVVLQDGDMEHVTDLAHYPLVAADGSRCLLGECADFNTQSGFEMLRRFNGKPMVNISGDIDKSKTTSAKVMSQVMQDILPGIESKYGVKASFAKQDRYQKDTLPEMRMGSILGLAIIYIVIAWISQSLIWPVIIMLTIPLGIVGAIYGHFIIGMNFTLLSLFGLFGLAGIVVNGSIILLVKYQELRRNGLDVKEASIMASCMRFRALSLTTITTAGGLLPLLFETSLQAQYLIPMATSLVFGLVVSTAIMLFLIPALIPFVERVRNAA